MIDELVKSCEEAYRQFWQKGSSSTSASLQAAQNRNNVFLLYSAKCTWTSGGGRNSLFRWNRSPENCEKGQRNLESRTLRRLAVSGLVLRFVITATYFWPRIRPRGDRICIELGKQVVKIAARVGPLEGPCGFLIALLEANQIAFESRHCRPSPSRWTDHPGPPDGARAEPVGAATGAPGALCRGRRRTIGALPPPAPRCSSCESPASETG